VDVLGQAAGDAELDGIIFQVIGNARDLQHGVPEAQPSSAASILLAAT
jgi:hypothetical protein